MEIWDRYRDYIPVYTDGSRDGNAVACATVFPSNTVISMILPDSASVFTAEVWAINKALEQIKDSIASKYIVFTDWLSCLQALHHMKLEHPLIGMVIRKCVFLNIAKKDIVFCWVPSHTGIKGNEKADSAAKSALDLPRAKVGVPYTDFKYLISQYIFSTWQDDWNGAVMNKLHSVTPDLGDWQSSYSRCRKDEVVLCRAPIHISWRNILHLCVSTVSVFWQFATFWWSAIILLEKGKIHLVEEMWWNHLCYIILWYEMTKPLCYKMTGLKWMVLNYHGIE